jgi:5-deoxy-glucuronate isomerase
MSEWQRKPAGKHGRIHHLTPADAGWSYVGFAAHRLAAGDEVEEFTGDREVILVLVEGRARITVDAQSFGERGDRLDVFEKTPPHAFYAPPGTAWSVEATTPAVLAVGSAPRGEGQLPAAVLGPEGVVGVERGEGTNRRWIHPIAMEERPVAERLLVTEVFTPSGHWSSYPPHRHDASEEPAMTYLEETYYHRLRPSQGFAVQRVYSEDGTLDACMAVEDHDLVLVPRGHHPCGAPHGYELYYLNVMAGPVRRWRFRNDPAHEWILSPPSPDATQWTRDRD